MANYSLHRYLMMTLDPVHIGTGGYRLGRVDLSIAREPGTNVPKIPGTSLSGALRQYAAYEFGKLQCAGKGGVSEEKKHCGRPTCPICFTFGHAKGEDGGYAGSVNIYDAQIMLFPVYSMAGPVWVTTIPRLEAAKISVTYKVGSEVQTDFIQQDSTLITTMGWNKPLNLGWLMLPPAKKNDKIIQVDLNLPEKKSNSTSLKLISGKEWEVVSKRLVIVTEKIFSQVVNSNLEVRTSVSINPFTGAAEEGALFTYEAIPRATWLSQEIVIDEYRTEFPHKQNIEFWQLTLNNGDIKKKRELVKKWGLSIEKDELKNSVKEAKKWIESDLERHNNVSFTWAKLVDVITTSMSVIELLGVGGMGTRGFGRIKKICQW